MAVQCRLALRSPVATDLPGHHVLPRIAGGSLRSTPATRREPTVAFYLGKPFTMRHRADCARLGSVHDAPRYPD